jgi:succinoglycan biosynthesis protein ExoW
MKTPVSPFRHRPQTSIGEALPESPVLRTLLVVVIPFFQTKRGILLRSLTSVFCQALPVNVKLHAVVIDDGSPVPARTEIQRLELPAPHEISIIEQCNSGVAAARNRGLDRAGELRADYIAFLDSDDCWSSTHIKQALNVLNSDNEYDVYFCDHERICHHRSYFDLIDIDRIFSGHESPIRSNGGSHAFAVPRENLFSSILKHTLMQASSVVLRGNIVRGCRFPESLKTAGEDQVFWLRLAVRSKNFCFSRTNHVSCGVGVNIYYSQLSWDSPKYLNRLADRIASFELIRQEFALSQSDAAFVAGKLQQLKDKFALLWARSLTKRPAAFYAALEILLYRKFVLWFPSALGRVLVQRLFGRFDAAQE